MRITEVSIPKEFIDNGVADINMRKLGNVVLIAGKNGSGKTRILNKVHQALAAKPNKLAIKQNGDGRKAYLEAINNEERNIKSYESSSTQEMNINQINSIKQALLTSQNNLSNFKNHLENVDRVLNWNLVKTDYISDMYTIVPFVPKSDELKDPNSFTKNQILVQSNNVTNIGIASLTAGTLAKIQVTQERWFNATHQHSSLSSEEKEKTVKDYELLKSMLKIFLDTDLSRNSDGEATIFGFPLGKANLSEGQKILIQLCIAIYSQEANLKDLILFLDEPENHLHPSVIIETLDRLLDCVPNGQIWISTHSIPLLAHFDPNFIWYVEDNKISFAGNIPEKVLHSLLGDEGEISKLQDFINLPCQYALNQYAYECLFQPVAVVTGNNDPQTIQINKELASIINTEKIKILDYGAGKGRLLSSLFESFKYDIEVANKSFDYIAFDKYDIDKADCEKAIEAVYAKFKGYYFNEMQKLLTEHDTNSFDVVIMCNVLHEIDPKDWIELFKENGTVTKLLKDKGVVLIIEDNQMPIGEKAYQKGFIVLDTPQIKQLFDINNTNSEGFSFSDAKNDGRLKAHRIPKKFLSNITSQTRINSLNSLKAIAQEKILKVRTESMSYKNGKIHAFWVQQFANTSLALTELE